MEVIMWILFLYQRRNIKSRKEKFNESDDVNLVFFSYGEFNINIDAIEGFLIENEII
jgi:hypothetical protein